MIYFTLRAWQKLHRLMYLSKTKLKDYEIQGFGRLEIDEDGYPTCTDVDMPIQVATTIHIESSPNVYADWRAEKFGLKAGMTDEEIELANTEALAWRLWWHKHPGSTRPTYSSTDVNTLDALAEDTGSWFAGMVLVNDMSNTVYMSYYKPVRVPCVAFKDAADFLMPDQDGLTAECAAAFANASIEPPKVPSYSLNGQRISVPRGANPTLPGLNDGWDDSTRDTSELSIASKKQAKRLAKKLERSGSPVSTILDPVQRFKPVERNSGVEYTELTNCPVLVRTCPRCTAALVPGSMREPQAGGVIAVTFVALCTMCNKDEDACDCTWSLIQDRAIAMSRPEAEVAAILARIFDEDKVGSNVESGDRLAEEYAEWESLAHLL